MKKLFLSLVYIQLCIPLVAYSEIDQPTNTVPAFTFSETSYNKKLKAYRVWYDHRSGRGDIIQYDVNTQGGTLETSVRWDKATVNDPYPTNPGNKNWSALLNIKAKGANFWKKRRVVFFDKASKSQKDFKWNQLNANQQQLLGSEELLNYIRGDQSNEIPNGLLRPRQGILGDFIRSELTYVSPPDDVYSDTDYDTFKTTHEKRTPKLLIGGNDGMLHMFNAKNGQEIFSYIPSAVMQNLPKLAQDPFDHTHFVDGPITVRDIHYNNSWRTIAVGGLGAGGKGYFGIDVTEKNSKKNKVLWELDAQDSNLIGYTYSKPVLAKLNDGKFYVITGNGYYSQSGKSALLIIDPVNGKIVKSIVTSSGNNQNGLSSPSAVDFNIDGTIDYVYAGDLKGRMYRFDLTGTTPGSWKVAHSGSPIFDAGDKQPITLAPDVTFTPALGMIVMFPTGQLIKPEDVDDTHKQSIYGIWDRAISDDSLYKGPIKKSKLVKQTLSSDKTYNGQQIVRTLTGPKNSSQAIQLQNKKQGWYVDLPDDLRVIANPVALRGGRFKITATNVKTLENWAGELEYKFGGAYRKSIFDLNGDGARDKKDRVGNPDDGPKSIPMFLKKEDGFMSGPKVIFQKNGSDMVYRNVIFIPELKTVTVTDINNVYEAISISVNCTDASGKIICGTDLIGGHVDVDIYDGWGDKSYKHEHEYDDKHNRTYVDYMEMDSISGFKSPQMNGEFLILLANADLSPGAMIQIGNHVWNALEYQTILHKALLAWDGSSPLTTPLGKPLTFTKSDITNNGGTLRFAFDDLAIGQGGVHPTETGCVKDSTSLNDLVKGRWRDGALTMQIVSKAAFVPNKVMQGVYQQNPTDLETHFLYFDGGQTVGLKLIDNGVKYGGLLASAAKSNHMQYEGTIFWHWKEKACYGDSDWENKKASIIGSIQSGNSAFIDENDFEELEKIREIIIDLKMIDITNLDDAIAFATACKDSDSKCKDAYDQLTNIKQNNGHLGQVVVVNWKSSGSSSTTTQTVAELPTFEEEVKGDSEDGPYFKAGRRSWIDYPLD